MRACTMKPDAPRPDWSTGTMWSHVHDCRAMLHVHGFLTDSESEKVIERINKWVKQETDNKLPLTPEKR